MPRRFGVTMSHMTMTQRRSQKCGGSANPAQGVRVDRIPSKPVRLTEAGRIALPLWVLRDGRHLGDAELVLTHDEAVALRDELTGLLAQWGPQ